MNSMTDRDPARLDYERLADALPEHVIRAVADAVSPQEIDAHNSAISELVYRVMVVTYDAAGGTARDVAREYVKYPLTVRAHAGDKLADALDRLVAEHGATTAGGAR